MGLGWQLTAFVSALAMSQAFRTVPTIVAGPLSAEFGATAGSTSLFGAAFHLAFALCQMPMGVAIDLYGPRRTVVAATSLTVLGASLGAAADSLGLLVFSQLLVGVGCAPAFIAAMVFVAKRYPTDRFIWMSGLVLSLSGMGMIATATPLAWLVQELSWRAGMGVLAAAALVSLLLLIVFTKDEGRAEESPTEGLGEAFGKLRRVFVARHTPGILLLGAASYAAFITVRGLWLAPMLQGRHGYALVEAGHVATLMSVATIVGPILFGRIPSEGARRRQWIIACAAAAVAMLAALAFPGSSGFDVLLLSGLGILSGFVVLQYGDVRSAYPGELTGRALSLFNTAVFLGVAMTQWLSGLASDALGTSLGDPYSAAFASLAVLLGAAVVGFALLPWPVWKLDRSAG